MSQSFLSAVTAEELSYPRLEELVFERLRTAIVDGKLPPGSRLSERELAKILGVSRTPVREALARLEVAGLARRLPRQGTVVAPISLADARELFLIRQGVTGIVAAEAATRATDEERDHLSTLMDELQTATEAADRPQLVQLLAQFDLTLTDMAELPRAANVIQSMRDQLRVIGGVTLADRQRLWRALEEHYQIAQAVIRGDSKLARHLTEQHIESASRAFFGKRVGNT